MVENPLSIFWNSLNSGDINWAIFYKKLDDSKRKEAASWLIEREFVLSSPERVENMNFKSEQNPPTRYVVKYKRGRIVNPVNSTNLQETLYFVREKHARQYREYLLCTSHKNQPLKLEVKELNSSLVNVMRTRDGLFDFRGESSDHPSH